MSCRFRHLARRARGVARHHRLETERADNLAALAERMNVALDGLQRLQARALWRHQLMMHRQKIFADDVQLRNAASGDECRRRGRRPNSRSGSCPARRGPSAPPQRHPRTSHRAAACSRDRPCGRRDRNWRRARPDRRSVSWARGWSFNRRFQAGFVCGEAPHKSMSAYPRAKRGAGGFKIFRRVDAKRHGIDQRHVDAHAGFQQAQLLEPLAQFQRRRRQRDEPRQRRAAIGIKPDVVIERAVAGRARSRG